MKKTAATILIICLATAVYAQDYLSIHFAQTYAGFKYQDSEGSKDTELKYDIRPGYGVSYSKLSNPGVFFRPELGYKNFGATSILNDQKLDWTLHYLDFNAGLGYLTRIGNIDPYGGLSFYLSWLYKANQTVGVNYYDLIENKGIKRMDFGLNLFGGVKYEVTETNLFFLELHNSTGLHQLEINSDGEGKQKLYNRAFSIRIGVAFKFNSVTG